jgi:hypothetical protein
VSQASRRRARQRRWQRKQKNAQFKDSVRRLSAGAPRRFEGIDVSMENGQVVKAAGVVSGTAAHQVFVIESIETVNFKK